jgi:3-oxoacyl-[acyl-carrier protein] reductase
VELGLNDKVALVTGSYRGTGAGIAGVLAREGATVYVHGFEAGQPDEVVEALRAEGLDVHPVVGDICRDSGADDVADQLLKEAGRVDVLVNNYGVAEGGSWLDTPTEEWVGIYQKNVLSGVRLARALTPGMRERGWGRVIWLGTIGSTRPNSRMPHYYASKAALPNVCLSLAKELAGTGITVNLVSPGIIATKEVVAMMMRRARKQGWGDDWESVQPKALKEMFPNPTGRLADVEEVGHLVAFVASERADYINGTNLRIDGGASDLAL